MYDTRIRVIGQVYLHSGIHKRELARQLKLSMPAIDHALKNVGTIIKKHQSGNQITYFLDYTRETLTSALYQVEEMRFKALPIIIQRAVHDFLNELKEKPILAILFGSYAEHTYTKASDVDIFLVYQTVNNVKDIENTAKKISMRTNTPLNPVYLDYKSFRESFHNPTKEFFKRMKRCKLILIGIEWWRQLEHEEA